MASNSKNVLKDYECEGQMNIFDFIKPECSFSGHTCNKVELWKLAHTFDDIHCPETCCRQCNVRLCGARCNGSEEPTKDTISMFGEEWYPMTMRIPGLTKYDKLEILGTYKTVNGERWSCCPACLENETITALNVPWDIPKPDWKYWRLKSKVYPLDIKGLCDDPYCPKCDYAFITYGSKSEIDCERCPKCGIKVDWTHWHRMNDEEEEECLQTKN